MKKIALCSFVFIAGCMPADAISQHATNNPQVDVELLFSHDGCDVFRFRDPGYHYYVRCQNASVQQTNQNVVCGKNCVTDEAIQTIVVPTR
jgi:hypothetical protein